MRDVACRATAAGLLFASACLLASKTALADPQTTADLTLGVAGTGHDHALWADTAFHLGLHGDVLFGRDRPADFAVGPYLEVATQGFDDFQIGGGVSTLLPVIDYLPVVLSLGAYGRAADGQVEPGLAAELFWGTRSYNFHSAYGMSAGLMTQMRYGLGDSGETSIIVGAQLDLLAMSLPFVFLINAARGGGPDTETVR